MHICGRDRLWFIEIGHFRNFRPPWPWSWPRIGSYGILSFITHRSLYMILHHWNRKNSVDGRTYRPIRTDIKTDFIKSRCKNKYRKHYEFPQLVKYSWRKIISVVVSCKSIHFWRRITNGRAHAAVLLPSIVCLWRYVLWLNGVSCPRTTVFIDTL